jgi:hypothetical protein
LPPAQAATRHVHPPQQFAQRPASTARQASPARHAGGCRSCFRHVPCAPAAAAKMSSCMKLLGACPATMRYMPRYPHKQHKLPRATTSLHSSTAALQQQQGPVECHSSMCRRQ